MFINQKIEEFVLNNGMLKTQEFVFTINPFLRLKDDEM